MTNGKIHRHCYCGIWETNPAFFEEQDIPNRFCGFCDICGSPGHTRHYPGPVPSTGTWCDICYIVESNKGPLRTVGSWFFDAETSEELFLGKDIMDQLGELKRQLTQLQSPRSALIIQLSDEIGIDFIVRLDGLIDMQYSKRKDGYSVWGAVQPEIAQLALKTVFQKDDFQTIMINAEVKLQYYDDEDGYIREF